MKKSIISLILCTCAILSCAVFPVSAEPEAEAKNIASEVEFYCWGAGDYAPLTDGDVTEYFSIGYEGQLVINSETPVVGIYVMFYLESAVWEMTVDDKKFNCGEDDFLHEYVDVAALAGETTKIIMDFPRGAKIGELGVYTSGKLPDDVQVWEKPHEKADLVLFSSHSDDEQLFFAGVLPYSIAYGARTQVVYFCDHSDKPMRPHEQLNGLWAVGIRNYPIIGAFPDLYSESKEWGEQVFANEGYGHDNFVEWQVENLRRFKPQVAVVHDAAGEYGHGTHIINSETLREAVEIAADPEQYPYLTASYGAWDTPKVYLHLWEENEIVMDFDVPLDYYGGKTAYEMSCIGYSYHYSQQWTWFTEWLVGPNDAPYTKAAQIDEYSPCHYGLWRSTVGADTKADFFDNITLYSVQEEIAAQESAKLTETTEEETTQTPPPPSQNEDDGGISPLWIAGGVGVAVLIFIIVILVRQRNSRPPEPTRAQAQADRLREAREHSRAQGNAPSRADLQAQRLREARERSSNLAPGNRPTNGAAKPAPTSRPLNGAAKPAPTNRPASGTPKPTSNARPATETNRPAPKKPETDSPVSRTKSTDKTY